MDADTAVARIAAAIGEPARARMLYALLDDRARTATELALTADVSPSTASVHLTRLADAGLVRVRAQGKHRYFALESGDVAAVLESLGVLAGGARPAIARGAPDRLRAARTCYDHIAGTLGVALHDRLVTLGWIAPDATGGDDGYAVASDGERGLIALGIDVDAMRGLRRRFAFACLDWSERRPHLGGALGAAILAHATRKRWVTQQPDDRALRVTALGRRELGARLGVIVD